MIPKISSIEMMSTCLSSCRSKTRSDMELRFVSYALESRYGCGMGVHGWNKSFRNLARFLCRILKQKFDSSWHMPRNPPLIRKMCSTLRCSVFAKLLYGSTVVLHWKHDFVDLESFHLQKQVCAPRYLYFLHDSQNQLKSRIWPNGCFHSL